MRRTLPAVLVLFATMVAAAGTAGAATPQEPRLRPPAYGSFVNGFQYRNHADPSILSHQGRYYAYSTNQTGTFARRISVVSSTDLWNDWTPGPATPAPTEVMPTQPAWARPLSQGGAFWAPTVVRTGGRFVMYFAAKHRAVSSSRPGWCIGVATATDPEGPFRPRSTPFFCRVNSTSATPASLSGQPGTDKGAIDPQVFRAPNGRLYLHFKALDNLYQLWGVQLRADGLATVGAARGLVPIDSQARTWERSPRLGFTVLENPAMVHNPTPGADRPFVLFYAGGEWQQPSAYGTGYAVCRGPLGPCLRLTRDRPWLYSRGTAAGPGGASVFAGPGGGPWLAYHTYQQGHVMDGWGRRLHVEPLRFSGQRPAFRNLAPTGTMATPTTPAAGTVRFEGTADDADTGRPVRIEVREGATVVATTSTGPAGGWAVQAGGLSAGSHTFCAYAADDNGRPDRRLRCRDVTVS